MKRVISYKFFHSNLIVTSELVLSRVLFNILANIDNSSNGSNLDSMTTLETIIIKGLKILLVDDDIGFRNSMAWKLSRKFKVNIREANSGFEALQIVINEDHFDVILLDLIMPDKNGIETFKELRLLGIQSQIHIMSAFETSGEWKTAQALGIPIISKNYNEQELIEILLKGKN